MDGLGAFLTASVLYGVLRPFNEFVGMPLTTLTLLSILALAFCVYSLSCYFFLKKNWKLFLRVIIIANLLYCCLTLGLIIFHYPNLTVGGITYFIAEIIVIVGLVFVEIKTVNDLVNYNI